MYENVGKKIKVLAQVFGWISLIAGICIWFIYLLNVDGPYNFNTADDFIGWIALVLGVVGLILSWPMYGFGQLVDDVNAMRNGTQARTEAAFEEELPKQ